MPNANVLLTSYEGIVHPNSNIILLNKSSSPVHTIQIFGHELGHILAEDIDYEKFNNTKGFETVPWIIGDEIGRYIIQTYYPGELKEYNKQQTFNLNPHDDTQLFFDLRDQSRDISDYIKRLKEHETPKRVEISS